MACWKKIWKMPRESSRYRQDEFLCSIVESLEIFLSLVYFLLFILDLRLLLLLGVWCCTKFSITNNRNEYSNFFRTFFKPVQEASRQNQLQGTLLTTAAFGGGADGSRYSEVRHERGPAEPLSRKQKPAESKCKLCIYIPSPMRCQLFWQVIISC